MEVDFEMTTKQKTASSINNHWTGVRPKNEDIGPNDQMA
jgi:hypothetical protein